MEVLIFIVILIPVVLFVLQLIISSRISDQTRRMDAIADELSRIRELLEDQRQQASRQAEKGMPSTTPAAEPASLRWKRPSPTPVSEDRPATQPLVPTAPTEQIPTEPVPAKPIPAHSVPEATVTPPVPPVPETNISMPIPPAPDTKSPLPGSMEQETKSSLPGSVEPNIAKATPPKFVSGSEQNPPQQKSPLPQANKKSWLGPKENWEDFIGGNLANKIGIAVLVLGIGFFIKYAIDNEWISEAARVGIGLLAGAVLIGFAHRLRHRYRAFSSVLVGGGLAVLYFSIAFAFQAYALIGQQAAFLILVMTTAFAVVLALYYNRQEIAIIAALGGFVTPFLVSTGQDNYVALFIYLAVLCAGMTVLSWFKKWPAVNIVCMIGTAIIYGGWLSQRLAVQDTEKFPYQHALLFASIFFLLFMGMHTINNLRLRQKFAAIDFSLLLFTQIGYYVAGMSCTDYLTIDRADALFTLALAIFDLAAAWLFFRIKADRNFSGLLAWLGISFLALFAFIQLEAAQMLLFWAAQSLLLLWLFGRTGHRLLQRSSVALQWLSLTALLLLWISEYGLSGLPIVLNKPFMSSLGIVLGLVIRSFLIRRYSLNVANNIYPTLPSTLYLRLAWLTAVLSGLWEICYQMDQVFPTDPVYILYAQAYVYAILLVSVYLMRQHEKFILFLQAAAVAAFFGYLFALGTSLRLQRSLFETSQAGWFTIHWLSVALMSWLGIWVTRRMLGAGAGAWADYRRPLTYLLAGSLVFVLSAELYHINLSLYLTSPADHPRWENLYFKAQLSILWSICAFIMIWQGLKHKFQPLRVASFMLFTITILKLFLYDIRNIPPAGKIISFVLLGVLLLIISFMYQRIRAMLTDENKSGDQPPPTSPGTV